MKIYIQRINPQPVILGYTQNNKMIIERQTSHCHLAKSLLKEVIAKSAPSNEPFQKLTVNMGRVVDKSICVQTGPDDRIVYAQRANRRGLSRFVHHRDPEDCSNVIMILKAASTPNTFVLISAFVGNNAEPEPWDRNSTPESWKFWNSHALIWGYEAVIAGTDTSVCPW